jgi:hypothetical protein
VSTNKRQQQKINQLLSELNSGKEASISTALKALQVNGDASVIEPLATVLLGQLSEKNRKEVHEFLSTLNDTSTIEPMIEVLKDERFLPVRQELLSCMWNNKLDYSYYLPEFVAIAAEGNFMEAIDCLTIMENLEGPFEERHILESQLHLRDYLEDKGPKDEKHAQIMSEIALLLKDFDQMDDDDIDFYNA